MIRVFEYGLRDPYEGEEVVDEQISLAHKYYNKLVELEHERRKRIVEAQASVEAVAPYIEERDRAKQHIEELMKRKKGPKDQRPTKEEIDAAVRAKKVAQDNLKEAKKREKSSLKPLYEEIDQDIKRRAKEHRAACGVYWGTYLQIEQAVKQAAEAKPGPNGFKRPYEERPDFRRWSGKGLIAIQIQNGMKADELFGNDTRVRIDPLPDNAFDKSLRRGERNRLQRTRIHLRVGSDEKRQPIWASWPLFMHREIPEGSNIKWIKVMRLPWNQVRPWRWKLQITADVPDPKMKTPDTKSMVAVNLGWRKMDDGSLRVATWADTQGNSGELRLDLSFRGRMEKANSLRSIRDRMLDELRPKLVEQGIPCDKWKSHKRFHRLLENKDISKEVRGLLKEWAYRDNHLFWYERGCRNGALNYRKEQYRLFVLGLAERYSILVNEDYDLRKIVMDEDRLQIPSRQRVEGSPSEARGILNNTGRRLGCHVIMGEHEMATQECHICGHCEPWDAAPKIMHTCEGCGQEWDQDINNARNMLKRALIALKTMDLTAPKKRKPKWHKRHKANKAA